MGDLIKNQRVKYAISLICYGMIFAAVGLLGISPAGLVLAIVQTFTVSYVFTRYLKIEMEQTIAYSIAGFLLLFITQNGAVFFVIIGLCPIVAFGIYAGVKKY